MGTQDYVSPEVLAGEASGVTKACDLWALGCILYQLFSGALIVVKLYNTIHLCFVSVILKNLIAYYHTRIFIHTYMQAGLRSQR